LIVGASNTNTTTSHLVTNAVAKKLYLNHTHNPSNALALANTGVWLEHFRNWDSDRPICVHAEGDTLAAVLYVQSVTKKRLHVCHVSTKSDIELIKIAKAGGDGLITCEVAPHHLFGVNVSDDAYRSVKPPLGKRLN
jgi:carbamoyl-phosphate synthase/aspartate carbamoyltransferase/dihydroorotase